MSHLAWRSGLYVLRHHGMVGGMSISDTESMVGRDGRVFFDLRDISN